MKKSKLLQNSKELLSRSFNPSKCKTSLRLAGSRLKLLRNKKEVQVKQMKREIAQLLESGQDQTARIRVEHVVREEKMMAAYDLLEIYCELVVARLPIIESQKNCPIDLKEAIASIVFSAPRCGDVPELLDVRKQFTAKYGKDFTTAAIELRPQCGVGRMLVEKLSATAPDGQTKIKILSAIAEEHNVKWDPKSFGDKDYASPNDLLVVSSPSSFTKESEQYAEPPHSKAAQVQARPSNNVMHSSPSNFSLQDDRTSVGPERLLFAQTPGFTTQFQSEARPPALGNERAQDDWNSSYLDSPMDKRRWNMEFKDATSAAQAAAESAERASMAARAAAELSSHVRFQRQYSTESHKSNVDILKDEGPKTHPNSKSSDASIDELPSEHTRLQNEQINEIKPNDLKIAQKYSRSASLKSKVSADDNSLDHGTTVINEYSRNNSSKDVSNNETRAEKQPFRYEAETANSWPEFSENVKEERIGQQYSRKSSGSQSSISDDVNTFSNSDYQKFENDFGDNPFVGIDKIGSIDEDAPQTSSHESAAISFDKYDSDIDDHGFDKDPTYDGKELDFHLSPFGQKSPERLSVDTDSWSRRSSSSKIVNTSSFFFTREESSSDLSENVTLRNDSELNSAPVRFDESDAPVSESDEDIYTRHNKLDDSRDVRKQDEIRQSETGQFSLDDEFSSSLEKKRNQVNIVNTDSPEKLSPVRPSADQPASGPKESKRIDDESDPDSWGRLNFGKLTGGLRHKRHNHLSFVKNRSDASSSSSSVRKKVETTDAIKTSTTIEIGTTLDHKKISRTQYTRSESDSDDSSEEEESLPKNSGRRQALAPVKEVKTKPNSFFGTDNSDSDENFPNESLSRKSHARSGISRRTKASPSASKAESHTKEHFRSEALDADTGIARRPTTTNSETPKKTESHRKNSSKWETYEKPTSAGSAKSSFWGPPEQPGSAKANSIMKQESEIWLRSEAHDSDTSPSKKPSKSSYSTDTRQEFEPIPAKLASKPTNSSFLDTPEEPKSGKAKISQKSSIVEEPKAEASIGGENTSSNKDEDAKKASHVHPKLPDYDTLFQSLRMNRS
ncbi:ist1-like protein [Phtheirospermum japonicum]|uniref:Ist1-like protein n=1 Tax=Phtheirospermum japonicum TaxID=374723 RepID=A0A830CZK6_9LAMI|nr:ist1-like protein [Phtheirospermum japonicum]